MFYRKIYKDLLEWKNNPDRRPLIIKGLRQIGKTTIALEFAKNEYGINNYALLDFRANNFLKELFDGDFDVDSIIFQLKSVFKNVNFTPNKTLLIFDEIQDCPNARSALKYFSLDGRYDIIATGSFLGISDYSHNERGIPVGFEEYLVMKPLDFEEFLKAKNQQDEIFDLIKKSIKECKPLPVFLHSFLIQEYKTYIWVGGMPRVVSTYLKSNDQRLVRKEQKLLLSAYQSDFGTHLGRNSLIETDMFAKTRINNAFLSIPAQLAKENQKFSYNVIARDAKGREYKSAIDWLCDYGLCVKCFNLSLPQLPLSNFVIDNQYKLFITDSGLYMAMLDENIVDEFLTNKLFIAKGAIFENMFAEALNKKDLPLYYFKKESGLEIDFIISGKNEAKLVEIKAKSGRTQSSSTIISNYSKYHVSELIKFSENNVCKINNGINYPYYLISFVL